MNKKQLIVGWIVGILICLSLFMTKDTILDYDKAKVDKQRKEYVEQRLRGYKHTKDIDYLTELEVTIEARKQYPYGEERIATNILGIKFEGEHYKYRLKVILSLLILGSLLICTLRDRKNKE